MNITVLLAQVFGWYMLIACALLVFRERRIIATVTAMIEEQFARISISIFALFIGLLLVHLHSKWDTFAECIISFLGWAMVVKSVVILFLTEKQLSMLVRLCKHPAWVRIDSAVVGLLGVYLLLFGYGVLA